ncbi:MAG: hypothetical protein HUU20_25430 [Pirellulales bacterium]|nr:hypothetical protein [Pirellulales bacterium]
MTDAHTPGIGGFALAEQILGDDRFTGTVIMMLSSGDQPGDMARCDRLGISAYLIKPVKQSELLDAIMLAIGIMPAQEPMTVAATQEFALPSLRVLLAEDTVVNQKLACALLERHGQPKCENHWKN